MYGNALAEGPRDTGCDVQQAPDTLGSINSETLKQLMICNEMAHSILRKVRGAQPEKAEGATAKTPERSVFGDAKDMRGMAYELTEKLNRLDSLLS